MGKAVNIFLVFMLVLVTVSEVFSQVKPGLNMITNRKQILLGEQFELSIELTIPSQTKLVNWPLIPDTAQHLEVISRGKIDSSIIGNFKRYQQTFVMTGFDSGRWKLPVLKYQLGTDLLQNNPVEIEVLTVPIKGNEYNDIHEIIEVQKPAFQWWKLWLILASVISIIFIYLFIKRKKINAPQAFQRNQNLGSFEHAIMQMNVLKADKLIEAGEMKKFYIRLYDILRLYMSVKYTDDMVMMLVSTLEKDHYSKGIQCLRVCEAVKFAKYTSSPSEADHVWREIYQILELLNSKKILK